ncbi:MAG: efflux RND transporter periplasmic adaptor subunit [Elusimicrobia bacterium]|nr:efflux RND transporter periplasmic adaptor subunit [Candidatus Obscuribacterium magneticum]
MTQEPPQDDFQFPSLHPEEPAAAPPLPEPEKPSSQFKEKVRNLVLGFKTLFLRNKVVGIFVIFVVLASAMYGVRWFLGRHQTDGGEPTDVAPVDEIPVNVIEVHLGRFQDVISAVGTLKGEAEIELRFEVDGKIEEFNITEGAKVRRRQMIARLSDQDARLKVEQARIELEQKERLYNLEGISKLEVDKARLGLDIAQSGLDKTRLTASRDGIIGNIEAEVGEYVNQQRKVATLVSIKNVVVEVGIIEKQIDKVYPGQKLMVTVDAYAGNIFEGTIETISPIISSDGSKTFSIRAKIPNPDSLLLPGMFARSRIIIFEADDAIAVPNDALVKTPGGFQVFIVNKDNVAEARDVEVGYVAIDSTQITGGLNPGDIVVVQRPPELKAGSKVKIIEVQRQEAE